MQQKSLLKNTVYNFLYTGVNLLFPIVTSPYISRVLGVSNIGKVNFATSIINWFILLAVFGTTTYGVREVAKIRDSKKDLSKLFSEIIMINGLLSCLVLLVYYILVVNINQFQEELTLYLVMSMSIFLNMFNVDWLFQGIEEYRYITIRNAVVKLISLIFLFLFIRNEGDYIFYGLISVLSNGLNGILNFIYCRKFVNIVFKNINLFKHFKKLKIFFFHTLVISIYTNLDQTLLGLFSGPKSVAYMNRSRMVINAIISVSTAVSNTTLPRASYYLKTNKKKFFELLSIVPNYILWITLPAAVGCIILASNIMFILGGDDFLEATKLLQIMSLVIIFQPISGYLQTQFLIPTGNEKIGLYIAIVSSLISLILNYILIPKYGFYGAGITIVIVEFFAAFSRYATINYALKYRDIKFLNKSTKSYLFASIIMFISIYLIKLTIKSLIIEAIIGIVVGSSIYILVLFFLKEEVTITMIRKFKLKLFK